ncbi:hypothetical protein Q9189_006052 [Teloschistes chrysophthalmus]
MGNTLEWAEGVKRLAPIFEAWASLPLTLLTFVATLATTAVSIIATATFIIFCKVIHGTKDTEGKKALRTLAKKFSTTAQTRDASTSSNLAAALLDPHLNLLHYYGYATFEEEAAKDHGLELDDRRFTLRDIFDLELDSRLHSHGHHVTLFGCDSRMYKTSLSNDVLGLVPACLYSGASSTVSTPRPFDDKDAAMYTREFYKDFGKVAVIDLAKGNRRTMLAIMEKRPALYHWGSFVVIRYWMSKVGEELQNGELGTVMHYFSACLGPMTVVK